MPRWSPDGTRLAFDSTRGGSGGPYNVWTINRDGSNLRQLTASPKGLQGGLWSPDGTKMALNDGDGDTALIDPSKAWAEQTPQKLPRLPFFGHTDWSPDSQYLAGFKVPGGGVMVFSFATRQYTRLTESGFDAVWQHDSRRLLYVDNGKLFLVDRRTRNSREILSIPGQSLGAPALTRDNRTLFFDQYESEADVWIGTIK